MSILQRLFGKSREETAADREQRLAKKVSSMDEAAMIRELRTICQRFAANEGGQELVDMATAIGTELNKRGGMAAMRSVHRALGPIPGARTLDMVWNGIGQWMG
jgi:hypothetical protein